ncbi:MAG: DEAD/DEAH box helicase family protein, partial [Verrucomicrobia bacterium]|nr:DEAD/DEAH box helicase family protein [Verrucomicrobiota bacterium]
MENPFNRPPINVSATLVDGNLPSWDKDYLAPVAASSNAKARLLDSLRTGEDPTIRDGVNMALSHLLNPESPKDSSGRTTFLVHDGTGTGKSFQAILAAKAMALETGVPALVTTRANLIPPLMRDLERLGLDGSQINFVAIEQLGPFLKEAQARQQKFSVAILDEAQDCRIPEVRRLIDRVPTGKQLFFSATPFHNIPEYCYFASKLSGKSIQEIKAELSSKPELHIAVSEQIRQMTAAGAMVHREFPFFGSVSPPEVAPVSAESRSIEGNLVEGYARLMKGSDLPRQRKLTEDLDSELNTASDATKIGEVVRRVFDALSQNRKVILVGDDIPIASRILRDPDGLPKETPGFLSAIKAAMTASGIDCSYILDFPKGSDSIPALAAERATIANQNAEQMARFIDGAYRTNEDGRRVEVRGPDSKAIYAPSQTKVILLPYAQAAGWPELNQRFEQAPEVSMIMTPTASADHFMQAVGRGSRRNSQGPPQVALVSNGSVADCRRLRQLFRGLEFIAATGSPAIAPFVKLTAECVEKATTQRALRDQR